MQFKTGLETTNENLYFTLQGKSIIKFDRDGAQRFVDHLRRWADGYGELDGTYQGVKGSTRFVSVNGYVTAFYKNVPVLKLDRPQCSRFCARIQAWLDTAKMTVADKVIREIERQNKEIRET
jgi:hypothetical protein